MNSNIIRDSFCCLKSDRIILFYFNRLKVPTKDPFPLDVSFVFLFSLFIIGGEKVCEQKDLYGPVRGGAGRTTESMYTICFNSEAAFNPNCKLKNKESDFKTRFWRKMKTLYSKLFHYGCLYLLKHFEHPFEKKKTW